MDLPFTRSEFLDVFAAWNLAVWPLQVVTAVLGALAVALLWRPSPGASRVIAGILAGLWLVTGIGYHGLFFSQINPIAGAFGALFAAGGLVFVVEGVVRGRMRFAYEAGARGKSALLLVLYGLIAYPLASLAAGSYPAVPLFGVAPCPTVIFTFGLLFVCRYPSPWLPAAVPVTWAVIGGTAAIALEVPQDFGLIVAGGLWLALYDQLPR